ncbi:ATP-binding protein [Lacticaseibacillus rhamnosus]|uniref:ATP-binding protein n=1 Tax=Lacticaseibacillus rhamnosus TaxID=47715 RepID=UPI0007E0D2E9|nr:ATP-binding protein [Lacticaseibacillus rhamnosus]MCT3192695.1 ATP-binding protein [Lacticaseibacillus rhamnosus]MCT3372822.1 ATP-binding protein [Lacticaseibacillus rhamnosus]OAU10305.1 DNA replication protein [Lacticaseibacillus rhamnosus]OAU19323.1 DNA replication protein [Lacticaseibacillus rhamnosus]OAU23492.1 DNA replication protein [Lacticaseibacillus rhamnosus]
MESTKGLFTHADVQKIIEKRGMDVSKLPTQEEIEKRFYERYMAALNRKKERAIYRYSVFPGNVPAKFTFDKWQPELQTDQQNSRNLGNRAYKLAKQMQKTPKNVILFGPRGTGKTSLALAMLTSLRDQGQSGLFISTAELSNLMSLQYDAPDVRKRLAGIERAMKEAGVLLLDDFGTEGGMKVDIKPVRRDMQELMYRVANARLDFESNMPRLSTIITTNNEMDELERMYNSKLISRIIPKSKDCTLNFEKLTDVRGKRS